MSQQPPVVCIRGLTRGEPGALERVADARYAPVPLLLRRGESPRYREISWGHFRDRRSAGDYANYGAEIQISDYRGDGD